MLKIVPVIFGYLFIHSMLLFAEECEPLHYTPLEPIENCPSNYDADCACDYQQACELWDQIPLSEYYGTYYDPITGTHIPVWAGSGWFPETPPLFRPFIADPRQITYSVGWRLNDHALAQNVIDVSYGDSLAIYEWCDVWRWHGRLRVELEGALWAVFAPCKRSAPLINADYYVGLPITYEVDRWSFRLRAFHISSHVGDEFLLLHEHKKFKRLNPSAEYIDFSASYQFTRDIRLYGVIGWIPSQDESFEIGPFYAECGVELHLLPLLGIYAGNRLYGVPFYAMHFRFNSIFKHHLDSTYALGYEWGKLCGLWRKVRVFLEYHDGYCPDGQFAKIADHYISLRMSYGY